MVDISQDVFGSLFLHSLLWGILCGFVYDLFGIVRNVFSCNDRTNKILKFICAFIVFFCDFIFCIVCAVTSVLIMYSKCGGLFRGMVYIGMLIGFLIYRFSIGFIVRKISQGIASVIRTVLKFTANVLKKPYRFLKKKLNFVYHLTIGAIIDKIDNRKSKDKENSDCNISDNINGEEGKVGDRGIEGNRRERNGRERISFGRRNPG